MTVNIVWGGKPILTGDSGKASTTTPFTWKEKRSTWPPSSSS